MVAWSSASTLALETARLDGSRMTPKSSAGPACAWHSADAKIKGKSASLAASSVIVVQYKQLGYVDTTTGPGWQYMLDTTEGARNGNKNRETGCFRLQKAGAL